MAERTAALRNLKLFLGIGCFEFQKGMVGMDSLDVQQISFLQCVTFCELWQLKGWQPRFQTTAANSLVCSSRIGC